MKIAFLISSIKSHSGGRGGHFYSLLETAKQLATKHEVLIVNFGTSPANALENSPIRLYEINHERPAIFLKFKILQQILENERPDIIHAFDWPSYFWARQGGFSSNVPICITKCGGTNPFYFPYAPCMILYSSENLAYFQNLKKYKDSKLYLIPNRISKFENDIQRITTLKNALGEKKNAYKFLRIARIGKYYLDSSKQLIHLVNKLNKEGLSCVAIFIGKVEDYNSLEELKQIGTENVFFFTESDFTKNAKEIIALSDAVLGTGRSLMEAAAKSRILLSPIKGQKYPLLLDDTNFEKAFQYNFSERLTIDNFDNLENFQKIKALINNKKMAKERQFFSYQLFQQYFDSKEITRKYEEVYKDLPSSSRPPIFDNIMHLLWLVRKFYR